MIEFKPCFEFSDLQGLAEFPFKDRFDADCIARFDENGDRFDWQQLARSRDFHRQRLLISGADLDEVAQ